MIPGAYYTAATRERFERVASALYEARLTREQTSTLVASLDRAARDLEGGGEAVLAALSNVPGLSALSAIVPTAQHERHGFVGLLLALAISGASATARSSSERPVASSLVHEDPAPLAEPNPELEQHVG